MFSRPTAVSLGLSSRPTATSARICGPPRSPRASRRRTVSETRACRQWPCERSGSKAIRSSQSPRRHPGLGHSQVQRHVDRSAANPPIHFPTLAGFESFSDTQYRVKPSRSSNSQCSKALSSIACSGHARHISPLFGSTEPQLTPTRTRVMLAGHVDQEPHFVLPRPVALVVVKVTGL